MKTLLFFLLTIHLYFQPDALAQEVTPPQYRYGIVVSLGSTPTDFNVLITRRQSKIFGFKYCRAFRPDGTATAIANYRRMRFARSDLFLGDPGDSGIENAELQKDLEYHFNSDLCGNFIGNSLYGEEKEIYNGPVGFKTRGWMLGDTISVLSAAFSVKNFVKDAVRERSDMNTVEMKKFIFSRRFPSKRFGFMAFFLGLFSISGYETYQSHLKDIGSMPLGQSVEDSGKVVQIMTPMDEFEKNFEMGLSEAVEQHYFIRLK